MGRHTWDLITGFSGRCTVDSIKKVQIGGKCLKGEKWENIINYCFMESPTSFYIAHKKFNPIGASFVHRVHYPKIWFKRDSIRV